MLREIQLQHAEWMDREFPDREHDRASLRPSAGDGFWKSTPGIFELDVMQPALKQWMLLRGQEAVERGEYILQPGEEAVTQEMLDTYYDKELYYTNLLKFADKFEHANPKRQIFINGKDDYWDRPPHDYAVMMENANKRRPWATDFEAALQRWSERDLNILELRSLKPGDGPQAWKNVERGVEYWLDNPDRILWSDNENFPLTESPVTEHVLAMRNARYGV